MKSLLLMLALAGASACAHPPKVEKEDRPPIPWNEIRSVPKPVEGAIVPLPVAPTPDEAAAIALLGIPQDGYVLSESKYHSLIEFRLFTEQLHANAVANTKIGNIWTDVMWRELAKADAALNDVVRREGTWWARNRQTVFFGSGFTLGAGVTILLVYGLSHAGR